MELITKTMDCKILPFRSKKLGKKYLVTVDNGAFAALTKEEFDALQNNELHNPKLFNKLQKRGIILTGNNATAIENRFQRRFKFLSKGVSLHIVVVTKRCNHRCVYCGPSTSISKDKKLDMKPETAKKVVDLIFQSPSKNVNIEFQGGEPLLNFNIIKLIVSYAKQKNKEAKKELRFSLVTNLLRMDKGKLNFIIKNNVGLCTSLDGPAELHNKNRPTLNHKGSYHYVTKWIKEIKKTTEKPNTYIVGALLTTSRYSLDYSKEIVDEYVRNGIKEVHLRFVKNLGYAHDYWKKIGYNEKEFFEFWKKAMDYIININLKGTFIRERGCNIILRKIFSDYDPNYLDLRSPCGACIGQVAYNYDGSIFSCDEGRMLNEDLFKIGTINQKYNQIVTSDKALSIVSASINDTQFCNYCAYKPYCGLCPVCNYVDHKSTITNVLQTTHCKVYLKQFDYIFKKILFDKKARIVFSRWLNV